jgi:hypothetical protein
MNAERIRRFDQDFGRAGLPLRAQAAIALSVAATDFSNRTHTMVAAPFLPADRMPGDRVVPPHCGR